MFATNNPIRNSRNVFVLYVLVLITFILCLTYSNVSKFIWENQHQQGAMRKIFGTENSKDTCVLNWQNDNIDTSEYESKRFTDPVPSPGGYVPVKPIYPDPVLKLRPDYFILPLLQNGPNNQLVGLREAIFAAVKLNRTVVIPKFIKHHTDNRTIPFVSPVHRVQVFDFCNFVSCVTFQKFRDACGYKIDAVFHIRSYAGDRHRHGWEVSTGMKVRQIPQEEKSLPDVMLVPPDPIPNGGQSRHFNGPELVKLFDSQEKCVIYPRPLYNLHIRPPRKEQYERGVQLVESLDDLETLSDTRLFLSICHHTRSPEYIMGLAEEFVRVHMEARPYVSVHWRYQPNEFMLRCEHGPVVNVVKKRICENAMSVTPEDIADSIEKKITALRNDEEAYNVRDIYFATPSSEQKILTEVAKILYERHGWVTYSFLDLKKYLDEKFESCPTLRVHYNDILSTTEMEMCALGVAFLGSERSSWSAVVHTARRTSKHNHVLVEHDGDVFKMSLAIIKARNASEDQL